MLGQIVIGTIRNTPEFTPAKRETEFDIGCSLAVKDKFFR